MQIVQVGRMNDHKYSNAQSKSPALKNDVSSPKIRTTAAKKEQVDREECVCQIEKQN